MRDLGHRAFTGFLWAAASYAGGRILVFVATLVLARLLVPAEFGLVAFALAVIHYLEYLTDLGLGAALIYRSDAEDPKVSSTAFWIGIGGGIVLFGVSWFLAPLLGEIGPDDRVVPLFRVLALYFLFTALGKAHEYLLRRGLEFRRLFWPQFLGGLAKGVVSIALAFEGAGAWSLIIGQLAGALCQSAAFWRCPRGGPASPSLGAIWADAALRAGIVAVGLLGQGARNFDYLVVGAKLGAVALGLYYLAFRLPELVILSGSRWPTRFCSPSTPDSGRGGGGNRGAATWLSADRPAGVDGGVARGLRDGVARAPLGSHPLRREVARVGRAARLRGDLGGLASLASMPGAVIKALGRSWLLTATGGSCRSQSCSRRSGWPPASASPR